MPGKAPEAPKRSDARRNRTRLLEVAFQVLSQKGVDAQMTDIAEAAGLGVGTLYRNFPSKEALVNALLHERLVRTTRDLEQASHQEDAWEALVGLIRSYAERQLDSRVLSQFLGGRIAGTKEIQEIRAATYSLIQDAVKRAKRAGKLRRDVAPTDIRMVLVSIAHLSSPDSPLARRLLMRHVGILIDGLRAPGHSKLPGPALSDDEASTALHHRLSGKDARPSALRRGRRAWPS